MPQDPVVLSLYIAVGLVFGTVGLGTARSEAGRVVAAATGYFLAAWHAWVLAFGGWCLSGRPMRWLLWACLVAVLIQSLTVVVRAVQHADEGPSEPPARRPVAPSGYEAWNRPYDGATPTAPVAHPRPAPAPRHRSSAAARPATSLVPAQRRPEVSAPTADDRPAWARVDSSRTRREAPQRRP